MIYEPGKEPEEYKKHLNLLLRELKEAYPDGLIVTDMWNHTRWDKLTEYLFSSLGYDDNISFLKAYGYDVFGDLNTSPQGATRSQPVQTNQPARQAPQEQPSQPVERRQKKSLVCPNCSSDDIAIETFQENLGTTTVSNQKFKFKQTGHGIIWWLLIGWWWWIFDLMLWLCFFPFRLVAQLFKKKKYKGKATTVSQSVNEVVYKKMFTCRACGHSWMQKAGDGSTMSAITKSKSNVNQLKKNLR